MNKKDCRAYKKMEIWKPELCGFCIAKRCEDRKHLPIKPFKLNGRNERYYKVKNETPEDN